MSRSAGESFAKCFGVEDAVEGASQATVQGVLKIGTVR